MSSDTAPERAASTCGAEWDKDGNATIYATGRTGQGRISGLSPHTAMYFAVILARNARGAGAPWPVPFYDDDFETNTVKALSTATGERSPAPPPAPSVDVDELRRRLTQVREHLENMENRVVDAVGVLGRLEDILNS